MKLNTTPLPVETSVQNATQAFSIKTTAKAFKILSDGLYKNKILAFVRELSRNAYDAHIAAGRKNVPFEIHLPNVLEPWFHVKDFGTGLSHENVLHLYTTYFESTKQDSNDFVGALGLGSKSPFSYVTSFTVKSRFDGIESTYTCFLSEHGVPSIVKMGEGKYVGHPGLEVVLPIEKHDFSQVKTAVSQDLAFWDGTLPTIIGDSAFKINQPEKSIVGKNWYITKNRSLYPSMGVAVQGNVGYPISYALLQSKVKNEAEGSALTVVQKLNPVIQFEIGKLDVTASREELSYDEPTIRNLIESIVHVVKEFGEEFKRELNTLSNETTELSFRQKGYQLISNYQNAYGSEFIRFFSNKSNNNDVSWKNNSYSLSDLLQKNFTFYINGLSSLNVVKVTKNWRGLGSRIKKQIDGSVWIIDGTKTLNLKNVFDLKKHNLAYDQYRQISCWDTTKKVLPHRQRDAQQSYAAFVDRLETSTKNKPYTLTTWSFDLFANNYRNGKTVIFLNDQQVFGYEIVSQYLAENKDDEVFLIDYNKRVVSPKEVSSFVKNFTDQLSGLKILSTSQIILKNPIIRQPRASRKTIATTRNINEVIVYKPTLPNNRTIPAHVFGYGNHDRDNLSFSFPSMFQATEEKIDFSTGDFYYFYEHRNKTFLEDPSINGSKSGLKSGFSSARRVNVLEYLNALTFFKIIPANTAIVALKPGQLKKISSSKKQGKFLPISELDKSLLDSASRNPFLIKANIILKSKVNNTLAGPISELFQNNEMIKALTNRYGDLVTSKIRLFKELKEVLEINCILENEGVRKAYTVLGMIRYFMDGTDRTYRDAWNVVFRDVDVTNDVKLIEKKISESVQKFYDKFPLIKSVSVSDFRYSTDKINKKLEVVEHLIDYVNLKS